MPVPKLTNAVTAWAIEQFGSSQTEHNPNPGQPWNATDLRKVAYSEALDMALATQPWRQAIVADALVRGAEIVITGGPPGTNDDGPIDWAAVVAALLRHYAPPPDWPSVNVPTRIVGEQFLNTADAYADGISTPWDVQGVFDAMNDWATDYLGCDNGYESTDGSLWPDWCSLMVTKDALAQINWAAILREHNNRHQVVQ
jgi:hypothetical protein